jgi:uncharacterized protein YkwD
MKLGVKYVVMLLKKIISPHSSLIYSLFLVLFLTVGLFVTVNQSQKQQDLPTHAASLTNCTVSASQLTIKTQEQALFGEINQYRIQNSVDALGWDNTLKQSAEWLTLDMATHNTLNHVDSLGRTPDIRLSNCGFAVSNGYAEAIADDTNDANVVNSVFTIWENDPAHKAILLDPQYNIAGVAMEISSSGQAYWTVDFGKSAAPSVPTPTTLANYPTLTPSAGNNTTPTLPPSTTQTPVTTTTPTTIPSISPSAAILSPTTGPVTADMLINVSVQINGIGQGGNEHPLHLTRKVTAYIYGTGTSPVTSGTAYLTYDGSKYFTGTIHLGKLAQGPYFIKLVSNNTLQVFAHPEFQTLLIGKINPIPPVTLYQGDMNGDNVLDITDYNLILPCFQNKTCDSASQIDFNDDGKTDVVDYNLLLQSFEILHGD